MLRQVIKQARIDRGLTIRQVALYAQINPAHLYRFEAGKKELSIDKLVRLLELLGFVLSIDGKLLIGKEASSLRDRG